MAWGVVDKYFALQQVTFKPNIRPTMNLPALLTFSLAASSCISSISVPIYVALGQTDDAASIKIPALPYAGV